MLGSASSRADGIVVRPDSLLPALRLFFLGVASGIIRDHGHGNRSMMVHPSQRTDRHGEYFNWVRNVRDNWLQLLESPDDPDYQELRDDFEVAYVDLQATVSDIEAFDHLMQRLRHAIRRTDMHEVNARRGQTPQIDWRAAYSHILVGGQTLDRGFTVEGLTVTYMPRGVGTRRADTIQQRARFFGYKRGYIGYCRVFLEQAVAEAFSRYVQHEHDIREQLETVSRTNGSLDDLRRTFLLPRGLAATRDSIIDVDYVRVRVNHGWFSAKSPQEAPNRGQSNQACVDAFLDSINMLDEDEGHEGRTEIQRHRIAEDVPLRDVYEQLLLGLRFSWLSDAQNLLGTLVILRNHLRNVPDASCTVYEMSQGNTRDRTLSQGGQIPNLFQGAYPVNPRERRGEIYAGDREVHHAENVTVQVHRLNLKDCDTGQVAFEGVVNVAIWIPPDLPGDVLIQDQGGVDDFDGHSDA